VIVHLNGKLVGAESARVSPFDRGFLFGDGVYEGLRAADGVIVALGAHVERMRQGLAEARIHGFDVDALGELSAQVLDANGLADAFVYWQVTRGAPPIGRANAVELRSRAPAAGSLTPTVLGFAGALPPVRTYVEPRTRSAIVRPDDRWTRGHIKSISLMGGVLAAYDAVEQGAEEPLLVRDGCVTEGVATNLFASIGGSIVTPPVGEGRILDGVTRRLLLGAEPSIRVAPIAEADLLRAEEIMLVGSATMLVSITRLNGRPVGDGGPGPQARRLLATLVGAIERDIAPRKRSLAPESAARRPTIPT
jgi:D-alanine transaminase